MLRLLSRPLSVAIVLTALLAAGQAGAAAAPRTALVRIHGSALPVLRSSARVAATPSSQPVSVTVTLEPRNRGLLHATAARHGRPLTYAQLRARFGPSAATRAAVVRYMRSQGMTLRSQGLLSLTFTGTAASASRAFHVGLSTYRGPHGRLFRAPDGAAALPAQIASTVAAVSGLDTQLRLHPAVKAPKLSPALSATSLQPFGTLSNPCRGAKHGQNTYGGYLPAELAQAYHHQALIDAGSDGHGESVAVVELSNYKHSDMDTFRNCFGLTTSVHNHAVAGGTGAIGGAIEVELDIEVAMAAAPGLDGVHVYMARNNLGNLLPMFEQMVADAGTTGAYIISDSWGLCEDLLPPSFVQAESVDLELAAAAGMSFYAATGDSGSSGCKDAVKGYTAHVVDDPASQPFVTGVGGTVLHSANGANSTAWRSGGGGISRLWPQPSYQASNPMRSYDSGSKCGNPDGFCRQVPDVAMNASLSNGYVMLCTARSCPPVPWFPAGGTSAGAPLMSGITADANSASNGATRVGFANPLLYSDSAMFWDITSGTNSTDGTGIYKAVAGYDPATGLGSVQADVFATDLASFVAPGITQDATQLTITAPLSARTVHYGKSVTFSGTLLTQASTPIADRRVYVELRVGGGWLYPAQRTQTDAEGNWQITLSRALWRNLTWRAVFTGSDTEQGRRVSGHAVYVIPKLGSRSSVSSAPRGSQFTFRGSSTPNMRGATMRLQVRRSTHASWKTISTVRVGRTGRFSRAVSFATSGNAYLRWSYRGGKTHPWMSATSPSRRVSIG